MLAKRFFYSKNQGAPMNKLENSRIVPKKAGLKITVSKFGYSAIFSNLPFLFSERNILRI